MINFSLIYSCDFKENPLVWLCFYPIDFIVSPCSLPPYQNDGLSQISDLVLFSSVFMCIHHNFAAMWYGPSIFKFTCSYFFQVQVRHGWFIQSPNKIEYVYRHPKFNMFINELPFPTISPSPWVSPYLSWWQHHPSIRSSQKKNQRQPWFLLFYLTHCNTYPVHLETHKLHIKTHPGFHYFPYFNSLPEPSSPSSFTCIIVDTSNWPPYFHLCYFRFVLSVGRCYLTWVRLCLSSQNSPIVHQFSQCLEVTL